MTLLMVFGCFFVVLLQHGADPSIRNTDGKTPFDVAESACKAVLTGVCPSNSLCLRKISVLSRVSKMFLVLQA